MRGTPPDPSGLPRRWHPPSELRVHSCGQATILPLVPDPSDEAIPFRIGVFGPDGAPVGPAAHRRGRHATGVPPFRQAELAWEGDFVFGGVLWDHFGHFLLESLSRAWAMAALPGPVLWVRRAPHARLLDWQRDILDLLGLGGREHRVVTRPVRVDRLAVPEQGLVMWRYLHPRQEATLAVHPFRAPEPGRRVWLSRSGLPEARARLDGEAAVESALAAEGWTILRPETVSIAAQLAALEAAEVIAGFAGSAFHGLVLGRGVRARVVVFSRGRQPHANYELIAAAKGLDQRLVAVDLEPLGGQGPLASYRLRHPGQVLEALRETTGAKEAMAPR